jgi:CHAT domain-containing protein
MKHSYTLKLIISALVLVITHSLLSINYLLFISPVVAQTSVMQKTEADRLSVQGDQLADQGMVQGAFQSYEQAREIYKVIDYRSGEGRAINRIGTVYLYNLKNHEQARTYFNKALDIAQSISDSLLKSKAYLNLGRSYKLTNEYQQAVKFHQLSLINAREAKNCEVENASLAALGYDYFTIDPKQSIQKLEEAQRAYPKCKGTNAAEEVSIRKEESELLTDLGQYYFSLSSQLPSENYSLDKIIQTYFRSLEISQKIGDKKQRDITLNKLSDIYITQGKYSEAQNSLEEALNNLKKLPKLDLLTAKILIKLAKIYGNEPIRAWNKVIVAGEQALKILSNPPKGTEEKLEYKGYEAEVLLSMADAFRNQQQYPESIEKYQCAAIASSNALEISNQLVSNPQWRFNQKTKAMLLLKTSCIQLKLIYLQSGQIYQSLDICKNQMSISQRKGEQELKKAQEKLRFLGKFDPRVKSAALRDLGDAYHHLNQRQNALNAYKKSIEVAKSIDNYSLQAEAWFQIGSLYNLERKKDSAITAYQQAAALYEKGGNFFSIANAFSQLGEVQLDVGQFAKSAISTEKAIQNFESLRMKLPDSFQISTFQLQTRAYQQYQKALILNNKPDNALEVAERGRARAFVNLLGKNILSMPNLDAPRLASIRQIAKTHNSTIVEYSIFDKELGAETTERSIKEIELFIWVVKPTGEITLRTVNISPELANLSNLIIDARKSIGVNNLATNNRELIAREERSPTVAIVPSSSVEAENKLKQLHKILIDPINDLLPSDPNARVVFVPQSNLFAVPFSALVDAKGKSLIEKHTILTAPSIQVLDLTRQQLTKVQQTNAKEFVIVGNPTMPKVSFNQGAAQQLSPLPASEQEANEIAHIFNTKAWIGQQATETDIKPRLSNARIIHLATHGLLDDFQEKAIPGAIALAPSIKDDGLLTANEILPMKLNAELVVLSACNTGQGRITGDGVIGLSRSLMAAGVPSVIVSLWSVPDAPTAELMTQFYRNWQEKKMNKAQALRQAMLTIKANHSAPKDWAAFTLIGEVD